MHSYRIRTATPDDLDAARSVMLDIVYRDFGTGYVPRWHADIIDPAAAYLNGARHTLLVAVDESDGAVATTAPSLSSTATSRVWRAPFRYAAAGSMMSACQRGT